MADDAVMATRTPQTSNRTPVLQSLPVRMLAFLSLALLPIGLLAVWQTQNLTDTVRSRTTQSLVAWTELATSGERQILQRAIGAAQAHAAAMSVLHEQDIETCSAFFRDFVTENAAYSFAGFMPNDGIIKCSSADNLVDVTDSFIYEALTQSEIPQVFPPLLGTVSGQDVVVVSYPVFDNRTRKGHILFSVPATRLSAGADFEDPHRPESIMIFNQSGQALLTDSPERAPFVPPANDRKLLVPSSYAESFVARDVAGQTRVFVTVALVSGVAYASASWPLHEGIVDPGALVVPPVLFPLLMWLASLLVAYFAVHRLVVRHIRGLRGQMRMFASKRTLPKLSDHIMQSQELFELEEAFVGMAYDLLDDEAQMEDALREKNVLLKEIHHRVKNNLQLISSIMNMQIRAAGSNETRDVLKRLQDRVLGLSTVHRYLYQAGDLGQTKGKDLLNEIFQLQFKELDSRKSVKTQINADHVVLIPDQAVPLALFAGEVATNAVKKVVANTNGDAHIRVSLRIVAPGVARLSCMNTTNPDSAAASTLPGLGQKLINAFATQLGDAPEIVITPDSYTISVTFQVTQSVPDALDY